EVPPTACLALTPANGHLGSLLMSLYLLCVCIQAGVPARGRIAAKGMVSGPARRSLLSAKRTGGPVNRSLASPGGQSQCIESNGSIEIFFESLAADHTAP